MTCAEVMTPNPTCCRIDHTVDQAAELMKAADIGMVPVVSDASAKLIGVLTDRDIVMRVVASGRDARATKVGEVMTPNPVVCSPEDATEAALERMASNQVRRMPIVDGRGTIVGIIAQADVATRLGSAEQTGHVVEAISEADEGTIAVPERL